MLKIYLVRHGQDQDNANGILNGRRNMPLTEEGIEQAKQLARRIGNSNISFVAIYTSPLRRAYRTSKIIAETLGLDNLVTIDELIERDFGIMTGKKVSEIGDLPEEDLIRTETITYFLSPEGAETFPKLLERAHTIIEKVRKKHQDGNILLVTHGDIGKMVYAAYYNLDWKDILTMFHFGNSDLLELSDESMPDQTHVFRTDQHNL